MQNLWKRRERQALGVIIRDHCGVIVLSAWCLLKRCSSSFDAEAEAIFDGVRLAIEWVRLPVLVESDYWNIINAVAGDSICRSSWGSIIKEIKAACLLLPEVKISRIKRESNGIAHSLAELAF